MKKLLMGLVIFITLISTGCLTENETQIQSESSDFIPEDLKVLYEKEEAIYAEIESKIEVKTELLDEAEAISNEVKRLEIKYGLLDESAEKERGYKRVDKGIKVYCPYYSSHFRYVKIYMTKYGNEFEYKHIGTNSILEFIIPTEDLNVVTNIRVTLSWNKKYWYGQRKKWEHRQLDLEILYDENLKNGIHKSIGTPLNYLSIYDVENIDIKNAGIKNIYGLDYFVYIKSIILDENDISDLEPVRDLKSLRFLSVNGNNITSLEPIKYLPLKTLYVNRNSFYTPEQKMAALDVISYLESQGCVVYTDLK